MTRKTNSWGQLINYMIDGARRGSNSRQTFIIKQNIEGKKLADFEKAFAENENNRLHKRAKNVKLHHEILSFSRDDKNVTLESMREIGKKYLELRGEHALAVGIPHCEKDHWHIHFCISGVEAKTGKALRLSKEEFARVKDKIQEFQKERFPELFKSVVNHAKGISRGKKKDREYQLKKRTKELSEKEKVKLIVSRAYNKALSHKDFIKLIEAEGLELYMRGGKIAGIQGLRKMRFTTLGFDTSKLDNLSQAKNEFDNIRGIRERHTKSVGRDVKLQEDEQKGIETNEIDSPDIDF